MSFDLTSVKDEKKTWLRTAGVQQNAKLVKLDYIYNEAWEGFDVELRTADGKVFSERTFAPNPDKVYPKPMWQDGKQVGTETKEQAVARIEDEIAQKVFYLALCFTDAETIKHKVKNCNGMKELVDRTNAVIKASGNADISLNFLTIWKNNDGKAKSNLIIAERIKWIEPTQFSEDGKEKSATITLTKWQKENGLIEKYPYNGNAQPAGQTVASESLSF